LLKDITYFRLIINAKTKTIKLVGILIEKIKAGVFMNKTLGAL